VKKTIYKLNSKLFITMRQRYKIDGSEIKRILEMHDRENPNKRLILEQDDKLKEELQTLINNKCFPTRTPPNPIPPGWIQTPIVVDMSSTNPKYKSAIKLESKNTLFKYRYFFINKTAYEYDDDKTKKNFHRVKSSSGADATWECDAGQQTDLQAKLTDLKTREGWVEYSELDSKGMSRQGADSGRYGEPKIFDLGNGKKVKLYKAPGKEGITKTGYTPEQTNTIKKYEDKGYKLADDLTNDEKLSWVPQKISIPGLPESFEMYVDPEQIAKTAGIENAFKTASESQDQTLKSCKGKLTLYYDAFKGKKRFPQSTIRAMREKVQACVDQHDPKWGGLRPGRFRDMANAMRGGSGGPSSYGEDSYWKLN